MDFLPKRDYSGYVKTCKLKGLTKLTIASASVSLINNKFLAREGLPRQVFSKMTLQYIFLEN